MISQDDMIREAIARDMARQQEREAEANTILAAVESGQAVFLESFTWSDCDRWMVDTCRYAMPDGRLADVNDAQAVAQGHARAKYV